VSLSASSGKAVDDVIPIFHSSTVGPELTTSILSEHTHNNFMELLFFQLSSVADFTVMNTKNPKGL